MSAAAELRARFANVGGDPDRLKVLPYESAFESHLVAYREIDIGLDPFPYNGTTTTCEALLMGVPVLSLRGDRFIGHVGESLLRTAGLDDWVAEDADDFVARASAVCNRQSRSPRSLAEPRFSGRGFLASPITDAPRFARHLEAAFRAISQQRLVRNALMQGASPD